MGKEQEEPEQTAIYNLNDVKVVTEVLSSSKLNPLLLQEYISECILCSPNLELHPYQAFQIAI